MPSSIALDHPSTMHAKFVCMQGGSGRGMTNEDVIHDDSRFARVVLHGRRNGQTFSVDRMVRRWVSPHFLRTATQSISDC